MMAIGKHKPVAKWAVIEASVNLGLSLVLVKTVGLYGVAWGTSLSSAAVYVVFWPWYVHRVLGVSPWHFLWEGWVKVTLCSVPFALTCLLTEHYWSAKSLPIFFGQILITLPVYLLSMAVIFRGELIGLLRRWRSSRAGIQTATL